MTPEARVRDPVCKLATKLRVLHIRIHMGRGARIGWPDDLFLIPGGKPWFVEFKAPGKRPRPIQQHRMEQLRANGYDVDWFDDADKACRALLSRVGA